MRTRATGGRQLIYPFNPLLHHEYGNDHLIIIHCAVIQWATGKCSIRLTKTAVAAADANAVWVSNKQRVDFANKLSTLRPTQGEWRLCINSMAQWLCEPSGGLKYNGYLKQSWQSPSIISHAVSNVLVFGPSAVEVLNDAASWRLLTNTDCLHVFETFSDSPLLQSYWGQSFGDGRFWWPRILANSSIYALTKADDPRRFC